VSIQVRPTVERRSQFLRRTEELRFSACVDFEFLPCVLLDQLRRQFLALNSEPVFQTIFGNADERADDGGVLINAKGTIGDSGTEATLFAAQFDLVEANERHHCSYKLSTTFLEANNELKLRYNSAVRLTGLVKDLFPRLDVPLLSRLIPAELKRFELGIELVRLNQSFLGMAPSPWGRILINAEHKHLELTLSEIAERGKIREPLEAVGIPDSVRSALSACGVQLESAA
jgi:hypothetical protein